MSSLKSTHPVTPTIHEAAAEGDLSILKRLVQDLDNKNPPLGKKLLSRFSLKILNSELPKQNSMLA